MIATAPAWLHWFAIGFKEALAMIWLTWWPLVLGFTLSGLVQSLIPRDALRAQLGTTTPGSAAKASLLGILSSSCSYAASAMSRALFARGASWSNSLIFMVASTNLVIELGVLLYLLLGWQFVLAQFVGGVVMIVLLALTTRVMFSAFRQEQLKKRVLLDAPPNERASGSSWRERVHHKGNFTLAARYSIGDLTMLRKELLAGFLVAGFISVHVPASWWSHIFISGHGAWTVVENAVLAPLVAVIAFVCSVGNIPLAAALWAHGVAFGGVIAFIFADLITLPLLAIYRRFYGGASTWRLFALLWFVMSVGGLLVNGLFHLAHLVPTSHHVRALSGDFPLGSTLVLNVLATLVLLYVWLLARRPQEQALSATDPVCGMTIDVASPASTWVLNGETFYFCSLRCRDRFERDHRESPGDDTMVEDLEGDQVDPVCSMRVSSKSALSAQGPDQVTYYFCGEGCRRTFLDGSSPPASQPIELGRKSPDE
ncbi:MAG TPA: permease [Acidimicrobiales bacterium]|nr:permease [Acidimicrobiales bacterium]